MALNVVMQGADAEAAEVVAEDRVLDEDLNDVVVMQDQVRHLEPEPQHADQKGGEKSRTRVGVDAAPGGEQRSLERRGQQGIHRNRPPGRIGVERLRAAVWCASAALLLRGA